ncbi:putative inner membrane protein [Marinomonas sp. MED121]|jgi:hypothetical protein|uniref:AzlD domain-containing protein n=1 Tax=Marinomonas sp. MED121 TaxID=314277 RepID=UPI00006904B5|nr:AzlD domain-containing protein [Marinomonas sp. MED121]EAQ64667.1 putative inner membrane protein [Marinomonas sp. MED121]
MDNVEIILGIGLLVVGTYSLRLAGPFMRARFGQLQSYQGLTDELSSILLFSLAIGAALFEAGEFAGYARLLGFLVAAFLAYKRASFLLVILSASITTAGLRLMGVA